MGSEGLHEAAEQLDEMTIDRHRAFTSLIEELEAIDWYDQRVKATNDSSLADILYVGPSVVRVASCGFPRSDVVAQGF